MTSGPVPRIDIEIWPSNLERSEQGEGNTFVHHWSTKWDFQGKPVPAYLELREADPKEGKPKRWCAKVETKLAVTVGLFGENYDWEIIAERFETETQGAKVTVLDGVRYLSPSPAGCVYFPYIACCYHPNTNNGHQ
jgi:hypothetical protein